MAISLSDRILVVDDVADNLFLLQAILEIEGYDVEIADKGSVALAKIEASPPDLVLLDLMMPEMNGYEVTHRIRQNAKVPPIPIVLVTACEEASVTKGLELGANDFIRKPINFDDLTATVKAFLGLKHNLVSIR